MLVILFLSCLGPDPISLAHDACRGLPGTTVDAAGLALSRGVFDEAERALWAQPAPSLGLETIGVPGYGVIRANSTCRVEGVERRPEGGWTAAVVRVEPEVDPGDFETREVEELDAVERSFSLELVETDEGLRARAGVARARTAAADALALRDAGDLDGALAGFEALYAWFPDPLLLWDMDEVRGRAGALETLDWALVAAERVVLRHQGPRRVNLAATIRRGEFSEALIQDALHPGVEAVHPLSEAMIEAREPLELSVDRVNVYP